jgi:hypothetical protein
LIINGGEAMGESTSNWHQATVSPCPFCGEERQIEPHGFDWLCHSCSRTYPALSVSDRRLLQSFGIGTGELQRAPEMNRA